METLEEPNILRQKDKKPAKAILVVDDSPDMLFLLKTILEVGDYEVFTAQSGTEAFKLLSEIDTPDLILLDFQMEEMNGPDFLIMLNEKMPELIKAIPVVFLTAMSEVPESSAVGFIQKPIVDIDTFLKATQRFIESGTGHSLYEH